LICVKIEKGGKALNIRGGWPIPKVAIGKERTNCEKLKPDKEKKKGKDSANQAVISVAPKGENEFVVITAGKSLSFVAEDSALRSRWVEDIQRELETPSPGT